MGAWILGLCLKALLLSDDNRFDLELPKRNSVKCRAIPIF